jgi:hypothetical protein
MPRLRSALLAIALGATFVGACARPRLIPSKTLVAGIDFSEYTRQGFLFTPEMYDGPYEAVGLVTVSMYPEARYVLSADRVMRWDVQRITAQDVVAKMYEQAKGMGADALVNFTVRVTDDRIDATATRPVLEVSGFAIRRARSGTVVVPNVDVSPPE